MAHLYEEIDNRPSSLGEILQQPKAEVVSFYNPFHSAEATNRVYVGTKA